MEIVIKVLHICSYYYGTKLYKNLMENLIKNGIDTTVYAPCSYKSSYDGNEKFLIQEKCFKNIDRILFYYKYKKVYNMLNEKLKDIVLFELWNDKKIACCALAAGMRAMTISGRLSLLKSTSLLSVRYDRLSG